MRSRTQILLATVAACAATLAIGLQASSALAVSQSTDACALISKGKLESVLGLGHIEETSSPGHHYPVESDGKVEDTCYGTAYAGAKPTRVAQAERKLASGAAAEFGWTSFAADGAAPPEDLARWVGPTEVNGRPDPGEYTHVLDGLEGGDLKQLIASLNYLQRLHGGPFFPPRLGAEHSGGYEGQLPVKGVLSKVRGAGAYWADDSSHAIFEVALGEGKRASVVKGKLEKIARVALPAFGL